MNGRRRARTFAVLLAGAGLAACAATPQEPPVAAEESYLAHGEGPRTRVDLGQGEEQLLTRFQSLLERKDSLERKNAELAAEVEALRASLLRETEDRTREQRLRAGAEAEAERLRHAKGERELKILHLQMQVAQLHRDKLQLEITGIERQIEQLGGEAASPAAPAEAGR